MRADDLVPRGRTGLRVGRLRLGPASLGRLFATRTAIPGGWLPWGEAGVWGMRGDFRGGEAAAVRLAGGVPLRAVLTVADPLAWLALDIGVRTVDWYRPGHLPQWESGRAVGAERGAAAVLPCGGEDRGATAAWRASAAGR